MKFNILTPEQKRLRKSSMIDEYGKLVKKLKPGQTLISIRQNLADKYGYKNDSVIEQIIIRENNKKKI